MSCDIVCPESRLYQWHHHSSHIANCVCPDYAHGITMLSPFSSEKKQMVSFCSPSGEELRKFTEELRESITEVNEMEQIHIQCKHTRIRTHTTCTHTHVLYVIIWSYLAVCRGAGERTGGADSHPPHQWRTDGHTQSTHRIAHW